MSFVPVEGSHTCSRVSAPPPVCVPMGSKYPGLGVFPEYIRDWGKQTDHHVCTRWGKLREPSTLLDNFSVSDTIYQ
jgi:hypothetical protein